MRSFCRGRRSCTHFAPTTFFVSEATTNTLRRECQPAPPKLVEPRQQTTMIHTQPYTIPALGIADSKRKSLRPPSSPSPRLPSSRFQSGKRVGVRFHPRSPRAVASPKTTRATRDSVIVTSPAPLSSRPSLPCRRSWPSFPVSLSTHCYFGIERLATLDLIMALILFS